MRKFLKYTGIILSILILLIVVGVVLLVTFVSPNRFKPIMTDQVLKATGRHLIIDGDMSWTFFPTIGVKVGHATLGNPAAFDEKTFLEISDATVSVKLMPLFHGHIESSGIELKGMRLHLIKNASGDVNWAFPEAAKSPATTAAAPAANMKNASMGLAIGGVDISDASVTYADNQTKKLYDITHFELHAQDINVMNSFPVKAAFDFSANNPAATGHITLSGTAALNLATQIYTFKNLDFSAQLKQGSKTINLVLSGDVLADLNQQTLEWTGFQAKMANIKMTGKMNVTHLNSNPFATGSLHLEPFDLKETLNSMGQAVDNLQAAKNVEGDVDFTAGSSGANVNGDLAIETLKAAKLTVSSVKVKTHFQNGVLDLAPISANLYQGTLTAQAKVLLNAAAPAISLQAKLTNVQAEPLMQDLAGEQKIKLAGVANFETQITTNGAEEKTIVKNLNGTAQFNFTNGAILGLDLGYLVDSAAQLVKQHSTSATNNDRTNFGTLTGTAVIQDGVITNNDLAADSPRFTTNGKGTINLVNQTIDYALLTTVKQRAADQKDNAMNLYGIALPVLITGQLVSPSIRLDSGAIAKAAAQQQLQKVSTETKQKIQDEIVKQLPGNAGDLLKGKAGDVLNNLLGH
ncbi:MAG: AsmA family protein [Gammaproteobacteria bacterium]